MSQRVSAITSEKAYVFSTRIQFRNEVIFPSASALMISPPVALLILLIPVDYRTTRLMKPDPKSQVEQKREQWSRIIINIWSNSPFIPSRYRRILEAPTRERNDPPFYPSVLSLHKAIRRGIILYLTYTRTSHPRSVTLSVRRIKICILRTAWHIGGR